MDIFGTWRISGNEICFSYAEGKRDTKWDCTEVKLKGGRVIWDDNTTAKLGESARQARRAFSPLEIRATI
jgi:hypothetical protein